MRIGEKIKKLRTSKVMTQSELAGTHITRNMLSCIENGSAQPSLGTVQYLAERLNVSPGYLLADEEDEQIYLKHNHIMNIKKAFLNGDYQICRDICRNLEESTDDEIYLILAEATLHLGIEEFNQGNLRIACDFFDEALEHCAKTIYHTDTILSIVGAYFRYMRMISATLSSNMIDESEVSLFLGLNEEFCRYVILLECENKEEHLSKAYQEISLPSDSPFGWHLKARTLMTEKNFGEAYSFLHQILVEDRPIPEPVLYFVFCDLEICCKEIEDYKGAYEYASAKLEILQKLLS